MTTSKKAAANALNAQNSTGPRTEAGQARSSQNAVKHGLTAQELIVRPDQQAEFDELHQALRDEIAPEGALEQFSFNQLLHAAWKAQSIARMEEEILLGGLEAIQDQQTAQTLDRLQRYAAAADRAYYRALKELRALQTSRGMRLIVPTETAEAIPTLASIPALTKQTYDMDRNAESEVIKTPEVIENPPTPAMPMPREFNTEDAAVAA
jgi:hypothetical protein